MPPDGLPELLGLSLHLSQMGGGWGSMGGPWGLQSLLGTRPLATHMGSGQEQEKAQESPEGPAGEPRVFPPALLPALCVGLFLQPGN